MGESEPNELVSNVFLFIFNRYHIILQTNVFMNKSVARMQCMGVPSL